MKRWQADGLLLSVAAIWGLAFVPQSWGMANVGPFAFTGLRFALGALIVAPLAWREARRPHALPVHTEGPPRWLLLLGMGLLIFLGAALQQVGMLTTSVTNAGFLTALYVPAVPLLGWLIFKRRPHWIVWPAAVGCVLGTWLLAGAKGVDMVEGDWWVIASSVPWALHVVLVGWAADRLGAPYTVALAQFVVCSVLSLVVSAFIETTTLSGVTAALGALAYTGIISVGGGLHRAGHRAAPHPCGRCGADPVERDGVCGPLRGFAGRGPAECGRTDRLRHHPGLHRGVAVDAALGPGQGRLIGG